MIYCKRHLIATGFMLILPLMVWAEAPVVGGDEHFAMRDEQWAQKVPTAHSRYDDNEAGYYIENSQVGEERALARDDQVHDSNNVIGNAKLIDQVHNLQQEIQELRGQLEIQAHDLKLLQQQQITFYKDLDARFNGAMPSKEASNKSSLPLSKDITTQTLPSTAIGNKALSAKVNPADEQISYLAAYELVKSKQYDEAINNMLVFVQKYPRGGYTANAYYWLGELYLVKKNYAQAIEYFNVVLQQFPISNKSAASMLKIGYAYAAQGNKQEAKKFLQQVVSAYPDTPTAELARSKLRTI